MVACFLATTFLSCFFGMAEEPVVDAVSPAQLFSRESGRGPKRVRAGDLGVGRRLPDVTFIDLAGRHHSLASVGDAKALVFAMTSTSCPISRKYLPTLAALIKNPDFKEVRWICINPIATDSQEDMLAAAKTLGPHVIYVHDREGLLSQAIDTRTTADAIVFDSARTVLYHGAIDDQYGLGYSLESPRHHYLSNAISAVMTQRRPEPAATVAPGCAIHVKNRTTADTQTSLTYHNRIARIVQHHCLECHRVGGVGPFSLESADDVTAHAAMIEQVVDQNIMPPWFAASSSDVDADSLEHHSPWANDRSLAASEKKDLLAWLQSDQPVGDPADAPQSLVPTGEWAIGTPDAIFEFDHAVQVKATGTMPYQHVLVDTNFAEDRWVQSIEIRPGDPSVVHHIIVFVHGSTTGKDRVDAEEQRRGYWAIYVPGTSTLTYPDGYAKRLPANAKLHFQVHYTPDGTATTDRTRIGLRFSKAPPRHEVRGIGILNTHFEIPPGAENHRDEAVLRFPVDVDILGFLPHMHVRGKACRYELLSTHDQPAMLLDIPRYDFQWQLLYRYEHPLSLKQGDQIRFTAWFNNSDSNPANPDSTKAVRWGEQTYEEMLLGYVEYVVPDATPGEPTALFQKPNRRKPAKENPIQKLRGVFDQTDKNKDGVVTYEELPQKNRNALIALDIDQDGTITFEESKKLLDEKVPGKEHIPAQDSVKKP